MWEKLKKMIGSRKQDENASIIDVTKKQLKKNRAVLESLRDYDRGEKEISTRDIERRLPGLRTSL